MTADPDRATSMAMSESRLTGRCHCGAVEIEIPWDGEFRKLRRCDCSYCARRWAVVASVLVEELKVVKGADKLTLYTWGTGSARHYFCSICGIYTHHRRRSMPTEYGVNIANFPNVDVRDFADIAYLDGRSIPL